MHILIGQAAVGLLPVPLACGSLGLTLGRESAQLDDSAITLEPATVGGTVAICSKPLART